MPVTNLVSRIRQMAARALNGLPDASLVLIGVSGGPDSICLADALLAQPDVVCILAHLNHGLRGDASDGDAAFVHAFAASRGVRCVVESADVAAHARVEKLSVETAARVLRYDFFARTARDLQARALFVAHHADDQAETVLHRMLRGTGTEGLQAMRMRSTVPGAPDLPLLRPLLRVTRKEIEQYCADLNLATRHDASNDLEDATRNKIRHSVLPMLEMINPGVRQVLARLADSAASDAEALAYAVGQACEQLVTQTEAGCQVDRSGWQQLPEGLQRGVLRDCVRRIRPAGTVDLNFAAIEEARAVLNSATGAGEIALMADVRAIVRPMQFVVTLLAAT